MTTRAYPHIFSSFILYVSRWALLPVFFDVIKLTALSDQTFYRVKIIRNRKKKKTRIYCYVFFIRPCTKLKIVFGLTQFQCK